MKRIKVSIKANQKGHLFLCTKSFKRTIKGVDYFTTNKISQYDNNKDLAKDFVLKSFQIKDFDEMINISKIDFNQIMMQIEYAAMKLEEKQSQLSKFILKYRVIATKYHEGEYVKPQ